MTKPDGDYKVGYKRPPIHSQFKPGQSGNPGPKKKKLKKASGKDYLAETFGDVMNEPVKARMGNRTYTITGWEAFFRKLRIQALEGDLKAARMLMGYAERLGLLVPAKPGLQGGVLVTTRAESEADWEQRAAEHQAPYRCNTGEADDESEKP